MNKITSVEDLEVFKRGHNLTLRIYKISAKFPTEERFSLTSQMRKSAASIGANMLEGSHRLNRKEFRQFVGIARGSTGELKYHLLLAKDRFDKNKTEKRSFGSKQHARFPKTHKNRYRFNNASFMQREHTSYS